MCILNKNINSQSATFPGPDQITFGVHLRTGDPEYEWEDGYPDRLLSELMGRGIMTQDEMEEFMEKLKEWKNTAGVIHKPVPTSNYF